MGTSPIANDFIRMEDFSKSDLYYPLNVLVCDNCSLVQLPEITNRENLFDGDYVYHSSYSESWLNHAREYVSKMYSFLEMTEEDFVIEVASNDGYLLQYFTEFGVKVLGIEPAQGVADIANSRNVPTVVEFFGVDIARKLSIKSKPKLMLGNNVLAHVPDLHEFVEGFSLLISDEGVVTFEFPHLVNLIQLNQFDTIYHEHYSYLSLMSLVPIFEKYGLHIFNAEKLSTHGGSLRIYVAKKNSQWGTSKAVEDILNEESQLDPRDQKIIESLQENTQRVKSELLRELIACKKEGLHVAAYGAAAKGNTLLNYCGVTSDLVSFVSDANPHKQGKFLPGSRIPTKDIKFLKENVPDVLLVLPWNLSEEIKEQLHELSDSGMKFLRAIPRVEYF